MSDDTPFKLDESDPKSWTIAPGIKRVFFSNGLGVSVDEPRLRDAIMRQRERMEIEGISILFNSRLAHPWVAGMFPRLKSVILYSQHLEDLDGLQGAPNLTTLTIEIEKPKKRSLALLPKLPLDSLMLRILKPQDAEILSQCHHLKDSGFSGWPFEDLSALGRVRLKVMRVLRGRTTSLIGMNCDRIRTLWVRGCTKLRTMEGARVPDVLIHGCQTLDLSTLGSVTGLRWLWLLDQKEIHSFGFLRGCGTLEHVRIDAQAGRTQVTATDWDSIIETPSLRVVEVPFLPDAAVVRIASARGDIAIANNTIHIFRGTRVSSRDYSLLVRERADADKGLSDNAPM